MKKIFVYLFSLMVINALGILPYGIAEAARVAVVPVQVNENRVERASDFESYYWDIIIDKFQYPEYELMEDEKVAAVIPEKALKTFNNALLAGIADETDADIVVAMRLDNVKENPMNFRREPMLECIMEGEFASFNRLTGKYYNKKLDYKGEMEEVLKLRVDWQQRVFASELKRYINRTLENKKAKK